jgi:superfamily II DNA/RNA helicase
MVFAPTRRLCQSVADELTEKGFAAAAVHGDLGQGAREQALRAFRNGKVDVLVATDVAARGIDVDDVTHVINYECPDDEKTYVHRIGRTGRAGRTGVAVTFVDWADMTRWLLIDKALNLGLGEPAETYSTSPHLFEALNIPAGVKGMLPRASRTRAGLEAEQVEDLGETGRQRSRVPASRKTSEPEPERERAPRPKRNRSRTRTRNGQPLGEEAVATAEAGSSAAPAAVAVAEAPARARRRRRTRSGTTDGSAGVEA